MTKALQQAGADTPVRPYNSPRKMLGFAELTILQLLFGKEKERPCEQHEHQGARAFQQVGADTRVRPYNSPRKRRVRPYRARSSEMICWMGSGVSCFASGFSISTGQC